MKPDHAPDEEFGIKGSREWLMPPGLFKDVLDGRLTQKDFITYGLLAHLYYIGHPCDDWSEVADMIDRSEAHLRQSLKRLTKAGWLAWKTEGYVDCVILPYRNAPIVVPA